MTVPDSLAMSKAENANGAATGETNEQPAGKADNADDSAVTGNEFANVTASNRTINHGQHRFRGKKRRCRVPQR